MEEFINIDEFLKNVSKEPKNDRVKFQTEVGGYFRSKPSSSFFVYDGDVVEEEAEKYESYTNLRGIDAIVVKAGTSVLTHSDSKRDNYNMKWFASDLTLLNERYHALLVTSGAIGHGRKQRLRDGENIPETKKGSPEEKFEKQKDAVVGQPLLYKKWVRHFGEQKVKELLLTHDYILEKSKNNILKWIMGSFLTQRIIPVINEDDAKSIEEIDIMMSGVRAFGDNDGLSSLVSQYLKQMGYTPLLVLLSDTDGIYTKESVQNGTYVPIRVVKNASGLENQALDATSSRGRGGVIAKINAAREAAEAGIYTIVANGQLCNHDADFQKGRSGAKRLYRVFDAVLNGEVVGTRFIPKGYIPPI